MHLYPVTPPPAEPLTLAEVREHLHIDDPEQETALITRLIAAVRQDLDGRDGRLGRALIRQTWDLKLSCFPTCIEVPLPPLKSVSSVKYLDADNVEQTLSPALYRVTGINGWGPGKITRAGTDPWPSTYKDPEAVTVRFICGYAPDSEDTPVDHAVNVPAPIKKAMLLMIGDLYANRETVVTDTISSRIMEAEVDLAAYRVIPFA